MIMTLLGKGFFRGLGASALWERIRLPEDEEI